MLTAEQPGRSFHLLVLIHSILIFSALVLPVPTGGDKPQLMKWLLEQQERSGQEQRRAGGQGLHAQTQSAAPLRSPSEDGVSSSHAVVDAMLIQILAMCACSSVLSPPTNFWCCVV